MILSLGILRSEFIRAGASVTEKDVKKQQSDTTYPGARPKSPVVFPHDSECFACYPSIGLCISRPPSQRP